MLIKLNCPQCGAEMKIDDSREVIYCEYCGTKIVNMAQKVEVTHKVEIDRSNEPNLIISYASADMSVRLVTRIVDTGRKDVFMSGQTQTFHLMPGTHKIVLKIGKINYNREITIPEDNTPVRINASWNRRASISIDQPFAALKASAAKPASERVQPAAGEEVQTAPAQPKPARPVKKREPIPDDAPMVIQVFNRGTIAPWILTGVALLFFITMVWTYPLSGILYFVTALVLNPFALYFIGKKYKVLKVVAYVAAGIIATAAFFCVGV